MNLLRPKTVGAADDRGMPLNNYTVVRQVQLRIAPNTARQQSMWMALGIEAEYTGVGVDGDIHNGDRLYTGPVLEGNPRPSAGSRLFRVTGFNNMTYPKGHFDLPSWEYPMVEESVL